MKKIIFMSLVGVIGLSTVFMSCNKEVDSLNEKENNQINQSKTKPNEETNKANECTCSASGFWSSCSISCPLVNGVCVANCTTAGLLGIGWLGSVSSCTCGTASVGVGKIHIVSEGVFYDDVNIRNLEGIKGFVENDPTFASFHDELKELLGVIKGTIPGNLVEQSQDFFNEFQSLSDYQLNLLKPVISQLMIDNGRQ